MGSTKIVDTAINIGSAGTTQLILMIAASLCSLLIAFWWKRKKVSMARKESQRIQNKLAQDIVKENQKMSENDRQSEADIDGFFNS